MRFILILGIYLILKVCLSSEARAEDSLVKNKIVKLKVREQIKHDLKQRTPKVNAWSFSPRKFRLNKEYLKHLANKNGKKMEANKNVRKMETKLKWFQFHNISNLIKTLL
jgi:hypothetical protein